MIRRSIATVAGVIGLALLTACGGSSEPSSTDASATTDVAPAGDGITIEGLAFHIPGPVKAGEAFTVTNEDSFTHTFSDRAGGAFAASLGGGAATTITVAAAGTYEVFCEIHGSMKGELVVE